jgi:hypothetical protein
MPLGVDMRLQGYADVDWAGSVVDWKSTSDCCFTLGSAMVSWCSRKHNLCGFEYRRSRVHCIMCGKSMKQCGFAISLQAYLDMRWIPPLSIVITRAM